MAGKTVTYYVDVDSTGAVKGWRKAEDGMDKMDKQSQRAAKSILSFDNAARIAGAVGVGTVLYQGIDRAQRKGREFESQLANLEAITGITGDRLNRLGDRSLELSKIYGESASNIIEANKLVASQLAEKIDFGTEEGFQTLQKVSEQAVVLSKAAGIQLSDAVQTTTSIINQFNMSAEESERVINSLAAGSKYGAAEVPQIGQAMVNAGSAADGANDSFESVNAQIQVLAANGQVGERAGTALRAMYLRLQTAGEDLAQYGIENVNLKANGMIETLKQLNPIVEDAAALKKIFGEEAFNAAQILIRQADSVESLAEKVTGTNTAYEQAEVQMNTFDGAAARLESTIDAQLIPAFQETNGVAVDLINTLTNLVSSTGRATKGLNDFFDTRERVAAIESSLFEDATFGWEYWEAQMNARDILQNLITDTQDYKFEIDEAAGYVRNLTEQMRSLEEGSQLFNNLNDTVTDSRLTLQLTELSTRKLVESTEEQIRAAKANGKETGLLEEKYREYLDRLTYVQEVLQSLQNTTTNHTDAQKESEEQTKSLVEQWNENQIQIEQLAAKTGELTAKDWENWKALKAQNDQIEKTISQRRALREELEKRPSADIKLPDDTVKLLDINIAMPDIDTDPMVSATNVLRDLRQEVENYLVVSSLLGNHQNDIAHAMSQTEAAITELINNGYSPMAPEVQTLSEEYEQLQRAQEAQHAFMITATDEQIKTLADIGNAIREQVLKAIKARVAEAIALQITKILGSVPFPLNIAVAAGAGAAVSALFNQIPSFRSGVDDFEGGMAKVHKDEVITYLPKGANVITNKNVESMERMNMIPKGSSGAIQPINNTNTDAIAAAVREGMRGVSLHPQVDIVELDRRLQKLEDERNRFGA